MRHKSDLSTLMVMLELIKFLYDIGHFEEVAGLYGDICEDDYYELVQNSLVAIAPIFDQKQITQDAEGNWINVPDEDSGYIDFWNDVYLFSSPEMREYYRLCRLYEVKHSISPDKNPYMEKADKYYTTCLNTMCRNGYFAASFDNDEHPQNLWIECNCETYSPDTELIYCIYEVLQFYSENLLELSLQLLKSGIPALPQLPEKGETYV